MKKAIRERWRPVLPPRPLCVLDRDYEALAYFIAGKSQAALADDWGLSRERLRQIVNRGHQALVAHEEARDDCQDCETIRNPRPPMTWKDVRLRQRDEMRRRLDERAAQRAAGLLPPTPELT